MIIFAHLPKTAGTSFATVLEEHFGAGFEKDFADRPMNVPQPERNRAAVEASLRNADRDFSGIQCIHGHFLPVKYLLAASRREVKFVTWLRDPVERVLSHFYFTKSPKSREIAGSLWRRVIEEDWSLERFCLGPEVRNLYCQFLWGFPLDYFEFVGVTKYFDEDFGYFVRHYLGASMDPPMLNVGESGGGTYEIDPSLRKRIEEYHAADMALYRQALSMRSARRSI